MKRLPSANYGSVKENQGPRLTDWLAQTHTHTASSHQTGVWMEWKRGQPVSHPAAEPVTFTCCNPRARDSKGCNQRWWTDAQKEGRTGG